MEKKISVTVVDAMPGKFKTTWAMETMVRYAKGFQHMLPFIYITPYIDEVQRVKAYMKENGVDVKEPEAYKGKGSKSEHLKKLIAGRCNIVTTHALFDKIDAETLELFRVHMYALFLDEVHEVVKKHEMTEDDLELLTNSNYIEIQEDGQIKWLAEEYDGRFEEFRNLCNLGALFRYGDKIYVWCFPIEVFKYMFETYIMTHLFEGQLQASYYKMYGVEYKMKYVVREEGKCRLIDYKPEYDIQDKEKIKDKIHIYEGNLNYGKAISLSSSYLRKADKELLKTLKNNVYNYFKHKVKGKSIDNMWTTIKDCKSALSGKTYTKGFVPLNARATNKYKHKKNLAYVYNRYLNPIDKNFFEQRGVKVNEDLYSLSELLQWVFRSQIREGGEINLYIPSERMRRILKEYLDK